MAHVGLRLNNSEKKINWKENSIGEDSKEKRVRSRPRGVGE